MTDLATTPGAETSSGKDDALTADAATQGDVTDETAAADAAATGETTALPEADAATTVLSAAPDADTAVAAAVGAGESYAWAPAEPPAKKRRAPLWIGIGAGAAAIALVASSLVLIAPGTAVAGVSVGGLTPGAAADAIQARLDETTIVLTGDGGDVAVTGADLGAMVGARALADAAFAEHPMWNPTTWFAPPADATVQLDPFRAAEALAEAAPELHVAPVDAEVAFDANAASYVVTPAVPGTGIDVLAVQEALNAAFAQGLTEVEYEAEPVEISAPLTTEIADETAGRLNGILDSIGFYVGEERTVPIDRALAASWLTVTPGEGEFEIAVDTEGMQGLIDALPDQVNRAPENAVVITDSSGSVLREEAAGQSGRTLGDTTGLVDDFTEQLAAGDAVFELPVEEVAVTTETYARRVEVNLSQQRAYAWENDQLVNSWAISSGLPGNDTDTGHFRINAKLTSQDMGELCYNPNSTNPDAYCTRNVPWVMYYNGDEALHGAYWHNNFGQRMSHGCVNFPVHVAEFLFGWSPMGMEVWVHY